MAEAILAQVTPMILSGNASEDFTNSITSNIVITIPAGTAYLSTAYLKIPEIESLNAMIRNVFSSGMYKIDSCILGLGVNSVSMPTDFSIYSDNIGTNTPSDADVILSHPSLGSGSGRNYDFIIGLVGESDGIEKYYPSRLNYYFINSASALQYTSDIISFKARGNDVLNQSAFINNSSTPSGLPCYGYGPNLLYSEGASYIQTDPLYKTTISTASLETLSTYSNTEIMLCIPVGVNSKMIFNRDFTITMNLTISISIRATRR